MWEWRLQGCNWTLLIISLDQLYIDQLLIYTLINYILIRNWIVVMWWAQKICTGARGPSGVCLSVCHFRRYSTSVGFHLSILWQQNTWNVRLSKRHLSFQSSPHPLRMKVRLTEMLFSQKQCVLKDVCVRSWKTIVEIGNERVCVVSLSVWGGRWGNKSLLCVASVLIYFAWLSVIANDISFFLLRQ